MDFRYYIENKHFNLEKTLNSGQNITFEKQDYIYTFNYKNDSIFGYTENDITYFSTDKEYFEKYLFDFFELNIDYGKINEEIINKFPELKQYVEYGRGIRFISQDFLESSIAFIISQNNNINRILKSMQELKDKHGSGYFPDLKTLKKLSIEDFRNLGVGFRDKYLYHFVQDIDEKWIEDVKRMETKDAFNELIKFSGIGPKVANCILLFGLKKRDVFPVDVHIKRIMEELYFDGKNTDVKKIEEFAIDKFGIYSSYIQQYLFFWQINNKR